MVGPWPPGAGAAPSVGPVAGPEIEKKIIKKFRRCEIWAANFNASLKKVRVVLEGKLGNL